MKDLSQSKSYDKTHTGTLMNMLIRMKFNGSRTLHEHITEMINITTRLNPWE